MKRIICCLLLLPYSLHAQRDPLTWPFADTSIWNMPIGSGAVYLPAQLQDATAYGMTVDEDIIILQPSLPQRPVFINFADWDRNKSRCIQEGQPIIYAPIPDSFLVSPSTWDGEVPNSGAAILMPDGRTLRQTQPFAQCTPGLATSHYTFPDVDIYGSGIEGAHGGSGLSAIGGTLRLGELDEATDTIRHALKINLFAAENLFYNTQTQGYRWPALRADGYAPNVYGTQRTRPLVKECRMGALLALPYSLIPDSLQLETIPAKILARAFQQYGAYVVDDTSWDVYAMGTEWSPQGRFTEEFEQAWGFPFSEASLNTPWTRDIRKIFSRLHVVDNNGPQSIGGGGTPLQPLAPPFLATTNEPLEQAFFRLFPNPNHGFVQLELSPNLQNQKGQIEIHDCSGRILATCPIRPQLDLSHLPKGIYLIRIKFENGKSMEEKLVVY